MKGYKEMECEYKNKYGRCEIDDYNCFYKDQEKIEQCKERKENEDKRIK